MFVLAPFYAIIPIVISITLSIMANAIEVNDTPDQKKAYPEAFDPNAEEIIYTRIDRLEKGGEVELVISALEQPQPDLKAGITVIRDGNYPVRLARVPKEAEEETSPDYFIVGALETKIPFDYMDDKKEITRLQTEGKLPPGNLVFKPIYVTVGHQICYGSQLIQFGDQIFDPRKQYIAPVIRVIDVLVNLPNQKPAV